ncbi:MAG: ribokinase [Chloroflexi bacterium]|nr:ribokinase [Chloroflexota bacterium]
MDLVINADRMPRPGETVLGDRLQYIPGGKGLNQAIAARRLGDGPVTLIGKVGEDAFGDTLLEFLHSQGLRPGGVTRTPTSTGIALITIDATAENAIVVVPGANFTLRPEDIDAMRGAVSKAGVVVAQLEIPMPTVQRFFQMAREERSMTILNAAPAAKVPPTLLALVDYLCVNETELTAMARLDRAPQALDDIVTAARGLKGRGAGCVIVTLGARGSVTLADDQVIVIEGRKVAAIDPTGAGDCFVGGLAARLSTGAHLRGALDFANYAAALSVERVGASTSIPHRSEVPSEFEEKD